MAGTSVERSLCSSFYRRTSTSLVLLKLKSQLARLLIKTVVVVRVGGQYSTAADTCCVDVYLVTLVVP